MRPFSLILTLLLFSSCVSSHTLNGECGQLDATLMIKNDFNAGSV